MRISLFGDVCEDSKEDVRMDTKHFIDSAANSIYGSLEERTVVYRNVLKFMALKIMPNHGFKLWCLPQF